MGLGVGAVEAEAKTEAEVVEAARVVAAGVPQGRGIAGVVVHRVRREPRAELHRVRVQAQARRLLRGVVGVVRAEYGVLPDVEVALGQRVAKAEDWLDRSAHGGLAAGASEPKRDGGCHSGASSGNGEVSGRHPSESFLQHGASPTRRACGGWMTEAGCAANCSDLRNQ